MSTSPFKRRTNPSKTYSKRNSLPSSSTSRNSSKAINTKSDVAKLLQDSSEEEEGGHSSSNSDEDVEMRLLGRKASEGRGSGTTGMDKNGTTVNGKGKRKLEEKQGDEVVKPALKRSNSTRTKSSRQDKGEDSTNWDEETAITTASTSRPRRSMTKDLTTKPVNSAASPSKTPAMKSVPGPSPKRQTSPRKSKRQSTVPPETMKASPLPKPRSPSPPPLEDSLPSDPPSPPPRRRRKRPTPSSTTRSAEASAVAAEDDMIPPPFDYVPPPRRLRSSPEKAQPQGSLTNLMPSPSEPSTQSISAPLIRTILPSSSSPAKPPPPPRLESPLPSSDRALRSPSITTQIRRPPSPAAKDLSSLFSSFSKPAKSPTVDVPADESTSSLLRGTLQRNASGGIVASLASKKANERNERSRATTPTSPERPSRTSLDRSLSQPAFSSPLSSPNGSSPFRSPQRPSLGATSSLPEILSPSKSRSGSASPSKNMTLHQAPALGSAYRPVSFAASTSTSGYADGGRTRTYGGARSFRPEHDEAVTEASTPPSERAKLADAITSSSSHLPTLPPSLTQRLPKPALPRETYAQLRQKWGVAAEEELDEDEELESQERGARVIGTGILRAQGEGKKWNDEMGWTLDGLREGKGGSGARSSALELLGKTLDKEWMRRLKSSGMVEQVYLAFRRGGAGNGDRILDIALVVLLAALSRDQRLCEPLFRLSTSDVSLSDAHLNQSTSPSQSSTASPRKETIRNCELLETLVELSKRDWVKDEIGANQTKGKASKNDARHLQSLRDIIDKSNFFETQETPVTLRTLILQVFHAVSCFVARPIFQPQQLLCTTGAFEAVVDNFLDECRPLEQRIEKHASGLDLLPSQGSTKSTSFCPSTIALCLSIFEATSLSTPYAFHLVSSPTYLDSLSQAFSDLTLAASILSFSGDSREPTESSFKLLLSILGIVFGLGTETIWSDSLARRGGSKNDGLVGTLVRAALRCRQVSMSRPRTKNGTSEDQNDPESDKPRPEWDALCLILGTLTNLVESTDVVKDSLREILVDPTCRFNRKCLRSCTCSSPQSVLKILSQFYLDPLDDAPNSVHRTSVAGFLRLLLGLSLVDNPRNESIILDSISSSTSSSSSSDPGSLSAIIDALEEFAKLHEEQAQVRTMLQIGNGQGEDDSQETEAVDEPADEEVGQRGDDEDIVRRIRSTIERLKRRIV
ncbi:uncharacterized protein JCM6883_003694 [Sporobolomyces salmoneus]|uniref:uncharacterized protein n=1 Tax=Sporobolomyces salmoneus TaxID=183962 RepID=UPI00317B1BBF